MLVWEGDQKHLPSFIIQTREERRNVQPCNRPAGLECCRRSEAHGRRPGAGSTVDDRMMLTAARRECCTQGDAHGRRLGVLSTILPPRPGRRTHCAGTGGVATLPRAVPRNVLRPPALRRAPRSGLLASPQHPVQNIVVSFRRPKHLFHRSPKH